MKRGGKRRMTKANLAEATKKINEQGTGILEQAARIRKEIDAVLQSLRKKEAQFRKDEEEARSIKRQQEQQILASQQTKAWTMPDDDQAPAREEDQKPVAEVPEESVKKPQSAPPEAAPETERKEETAPAAKKEDAVKTEAAAPAGTVKASDEPDTPVPETPAPAEKQTPPKEKPAPQAQKAEADTAAKTPAPVQKPVEKKLPPQNPNQVPVRPAPRPQQASNARPAPGSFGARPAAPYQPRPQGAYAGQNQGRGFQQGGYPRPQNQGTAGNQQGGQRFQGNGGYARQPGSFPRPQTGGYNNARPAGQAPYGRPQNQQGAQGGGRPGQGQQPYGNRSAAGGRPQSGFGARPKPPELAPAMEKERVSNYDPNKKQYIRQHDPERVAKNKKQLVKDTFIDYDDESVRGSKKSKVKKPSAQQLMAPIKIEKAYMTADTITVKDLTERIGKPAGEILKKLLMLGIVSNINSELDFDTASLVCSEFEVTLEKKLDKTAEDALSDTRIEDREEDLQPRPPVITIMGHVDHGKTSLLDYIRKAHVTANEAGGITQHIGAYTVNLSGRQITFLDTPGHEAFTAMRMRGAQATDIAVLVVAADDGVMPQTIEAINHAKAANVPIIVAINKIDKPGADPERVKEALTKYELVPEEWGGETIMAPVSAVTGEGVDELLELILLQADMLQLRANPDRLAAGVIIEAKLDKARGPLATVLLKTGTLHVGDSIIAGLASGHVRAMTNDRGERVESAGPSMPVEIAGFDDVPSAGDEMMAVDDDRLTRQVVEERKDKLKAARSATSKVSLDTLFAGINEGKTQTLNLIIKADVQGSVEAVKQALEKLSNDDVKIHVLHSAVGAITQDDVNLAATFGATIIGFNIRPDPQAKEAAEKTETEIRLYRIIYQAIEDIEKAMKGMLEPEYRENTLGHAQVRNTFRITGVGTIAGCYVTDGKLQRNASVRLLRDNVVVFEGKLSSLKRYKDDVREAAQGFECGVGLENYNDIKENDVIECFVMEAIEQD